MSLVYLSGIGAGSGIAVGAAQLLPSRIQIEERSIELHHIGSELGRFDAAVATTAAAMDAIGGDSTAPRDVGKDFVDLHRELLHSEEISAEVKRLIREHSIAAEWAVGMAVDKMRSVFARIEDERFAARFADVEAVAEHLLRSLLGLPELRLTECPVGAIAVGIELSPLDALKLHRLGIAGFATERGGPTAHEAIIARTLGIPYVFGVKGLVECVRQGDTICVDDTRGEVIVNPDAATLRSVDERRAYEAERFRAVEAMTHTPAITRDGTCISMGANIEAASEVEAAIAAGADHIGLVRTEILYLDRGALPSEEEQLKDAIAIVSAAGGRPVTFRTLDIGGDKLPTGVRIDPGPNPALGLRGIRLSLRRPELFRPQLRALYRAAAVGQLRILFPLVSSVTEIRAARRVCREVCAELLDAGIPHAPETPLGAMIETPSAVLTADHIAAESDFLSVGTNDLIQYAFAADRQNEQMTFLYRPLHPSILRALQQIFAAAAKFRCPVSVCGDMAGDPMHAWALLGLGLRSFSMTARELPFVKSVLCKTELAAASQFVEEALRKTSAEEIEALALERFDERFSIELGGRAARRRLRSQSEAAAEDRPGS